MKNLLVIAIAFLAQDVLAATCLENLNQTLPKSEVLAAYNCNHNACGILYRQTVDGQSKDLFAFRDEAIKYEIDNASISGNFAFGFEPAARRRHYNLTAEFAGESVTVDSVLFQRRDAFINKPPRIVKRYFYSCNK